MAKSSKEIGLEVRSYFAKKGIKLADVARMVGSTPQTVTNQLSGRTFGRNTAKKWAEVFGFSATFLMTGEGSLVPGVEGEAPAPMAAQDGGVFIPYETVDLFNSMAHALELQSEQLKMQTEMLKEQTELIKMKMGVSAFVYDEKNDYPRSGKK